MVRCQSGMIEFYECATFIITAVAESSETPGAGRHGWGFAIAQLYGLYAGD